MKDSTALKMIASAAIAVCILSALIGWAAGYNFDERNPGVAMWCFCTLLLAFWAACYVAKVCDSLDKHLTGKEQA